ncbi:MAG: GDP-mannose 4,6-dehydratase, partial [Acidimicrobiales bacterium]
STVLSTRRRHRSVEPYQGRVYDVTVPNHILLVRRNGKAMWSGNCGSYDGGREKAPAAICRKVAAAKLSGARDIEIWGDGEQTRSFMFIEDCIEGTLRLFASDWRDPLNVGSSELVTINEMVSICEEIAGVQLRRRYRLDAPQGVRGRNSGNTRILAELGWEPTIRLRDGLAATYEWIYEQLADAGSRRAASLAR